MNSSCCSTCCCCCLCRFLWLLLFSYLSMLAVVICSSTFSRYTHLSVIVRSQVIVAYHRIVFCTAVTGTIQFGVVDFLRFIVRQQILPTHSICLLFFTATFVRSRLILAYQPVLLDSTQRFLLKVTCHPKTKLYRKVDTFLSTQRNPTSIISLLLPHSINCFMVCD